MPTVLLVEPTANRGWDKHLFRLYAAPCEHHQQWTAPYFGHYCG